jgi:hypothetical protein
VAWITGRVDLLGTLAYLAGFLAAGSYLRAGGGWRWLLAAWLAYGIGCFSKEFCLTMPVALLLWMLCYRPLLAPGRIRQAALLFAGFVAVAAIFVICRRIAFGPGSGGVAPLAVFSAAFAERQFDYLRWAVPLFYDFGRNFRPLLVTLAPALMVGSLLVSLAGLALWRWRGPASNRWRAVAFFGLTWYLVATLPMAAATYFSPRHLYLATAGLAIAAGLLLASLAARRWLAWGLVVLAGLYCADRFHHAVAPWRHAAKHSEAMARAVTEAVPRLLPGEILLIDVPDVHEGVWLWSWAAPFALQPPFQSPVATRALTRPAVYFSPAQWTGQPAFANLADAPGAILLRLDGQGLVTPIHLAGAQLAGPVHQLRRAVADDPHLAWQEFIATLPAR